MEHFKDIKKPSILIVDDQLTSTEHISNILEQINVELYVAHDGETAIETAHKYNPDLILLDIVMPEMNGYEVAEKLKSNEKTNDIPIIFLTGKTKQEDIIEGFKYGAVDYVAKPFNSVELIARVKTHIRLKLTLESQSKLIDTLQETLNQVKQLTGLLPICANCKKIKDDDGYWKQVEEYIQEHSEATFSHSLCNDCIRELYPDVADKIIKK